MKKNSFGNKPVWIIINTYMEISQRNSLCSNPYLKLTHRVFHFISTLFSPIKAENRREEQILPRGEGWL
jgi:hypothetical protein